MEGEQVRPSYSQGHIIAICVLQIQHPHHTTIREHPWRLPPNAASIKEQSDDHCVSRPSRVSWKRTFCLLIWERRLHLIQLLILDARGLQEREMTALLVAVLSALSG